MDIPMETLRDKFGELVRGLYKELVRGLYKECFRQGVLQDLREPDTPEREGEPDERPTISLDLLSIAAQEVVTLEDAVKLVKPPGHRAGIKSTRGYPPMFQMALEGIFAKTLPEAAYVDGMYHVWPFDFLQWALKNKCRFVVPELLDVVVQVCDSCLAEAEVTGKGDTPASVAGGTGTTKQPKKTIAEVYGFEVWEEIEVKVLTTGISFRRAGTADELVKKTWGALGLKGRPKVYGLLIEVARNGGTFPNRCKEKRWDTVHDLNTAFRKAFGLNTNPFSNRKRMGTQTVIGSISWGGMQ